MSSSRSAPTITYLADKTVTATVNIGDYILVLGHGSSALSSTQFTYSGAVEVLRSDRIVYNGSYSGGNQYFIVLKATSTSVYVWHNIGYFSIWKMTLD